MNRTVRAALCLAAAISLSACSKEGPGLFKGNYTFKTSGTVSAVVSIESPDESGSSTLDLNLVTEQGQMDIISTGGEDGEMIVTMNVLGGDARSFRAHAAGDVLEIEPFDTRVSMHIARHGTATVTVSVSGTASRYGNVVIFDLVYEGGGVSEIGDSTAEVEIVGSSVQCIAKLND